MKNVLLAASLICASALTATAQEAYVATANSKYRTPITMAPATTPASAAVDADAVAATTAVRTAPVVSSAFTRELLLPSGRYFNALTKTLTFQYTGSGRARYQVVSAGDKKSIVTGEVGYGEYTIDVRNLRPGAYFLRLSSAADVRVADFIKR